MPSGNEVLSGDALSRLQALTDRILAQFVDAGAERVSPPALLPADVLLDLYGEDIRARAFVTRDGAGELMLRPDFTVPVVQRHMAVGAERARYAYAGPVWRWQPGGAARSREYMQAGVELFDGTDTAAADADVFGLISTALSDAPVAVETGDMGILFAAIDGLPTTPARRAALRRHVWRPKRFHRLLDRFGEDHDAVVAEKADLVAASRAGHVADLVAMAGQAVGLRDTADITRRLAGLADEADTAPLSGADVDLIEAVLALKCAASDALGQLQAMVGEAPALAVAVDRFAARLLALDARGVDVDGLPFHGSFGRTTLEYYDGFVFGFFAADRPDLPVIASGGRYDALTSALGDGTAIPAVGGIVRPEALLALEGV